MSHIPRIWSAPFRCRIVYRRANGNSEYLRTVCRRYINRRANFRHLVALISLMGQSSILAGTLTSASQAHDLKLDILGHSSWRCLSRMIHYIVRIGNKKERKERKEKEKVETEKNRKNKKQKDKKSKKQDKNFQMTEMTDIILETQADEAKIKTKQDH